MFIIFKFYVSRLRLEMDFPLFKIFFIITLISSYFFAQWLKTPAIPQHLLGHKAKYIPEFIDKESAKELLMLVKEMREFPSNLQDLSFYNVTYEHIGEAVPVGSDGKCPNAYLVPSKDGSHCVFPGRIDIGKHFLKYGGIEGMKEKYEVAASRLQSFGRYMFDPKQYPQVSSLFNNDRFLSEARWVCPEHKQVLDPFQFNFIIQVPGQSVALHLDAVYFEHATRFQYPMWLLAVMQHSGLFQAEFIDQVQVVGYLHEWNSTERGGKFTYWNENTLNPAIEEAFPRAGSVIDGSKVIHASTIYYPERQPPILRKDAKNSLIYNGDDKWEIRADGKLLRSYVTDDLRITIVYRARCFESEEKKSEFGKWYQNAPAETVRPVSDILDELKQDLVERRSYDTEYLDGLSAYKLGHLLMDEYIKYPVPATAVFPFNYCVADRLFPIMKPVVDLIC